MPRDTIASKVIRRFAADRRAIASDWRIHIAYMHVARSGGYVLPSAERAKRLIKEMLQAGEIEQIEGVSGVYRIAVPFAETLSVPDEIVIQEANPTAVFSYYTAVAYHDLTNEIPKDYHLTQYQGSRSRLPFGTSSDDWVDVPDPHLRTPGKLCGQTIQWHRTQKLMWDFGSMIGYAQGYPIYVTDLERTLLDCLRFPDKCGGNSEVMRIWIRAREGFRLNVLLDYAERFGQKLLLQRTGYILERLGITDPRLDKWAEESVRGSSAKLFANLEFEPSYSERWAISLNVPEAVLSLLDAGE